MTSHDAGVSFLSRLLGRAYLLLEKAYLPPSSPGYVACSFLEGGHCLLHAAPRYRVGSDATLGVQHLETSQVALCSRATACLASCRHRLDSDGNHSHQCQRDADGEGPRPAVPIDRCCCSSKYGMVAWRDAMPQSAFVVRVYYL